MSQRLTLVELPVTPQDPRSSSARSGSRPRSPAPALGSRSARAPGSPAQVGPCSPKPAGQPSDFLLRTRRLKQFSLALSMISMP